MILDYNLFIYKVNDSDNGDYIVKQFSYLSKTLK